ncbi:MAG TPA: hypothetical protein VK631_11625 [Solirubrobacteraceae bacterium]|nr:hypothetical protein [Solirubrobacteraceae bacterium]
MWQAARTVPVRETRTLRPLIAWRLGRYAPAGDVPLRTVLASHPFHLLGEEGTVSVSGLAGKLWAPGDAFVRFDGPAAFRGWAEPGFCKVVVRHEVLAHDAGGSEIASDVRIWCTSRGAQLRFRPYWALIGPFSRFIGSELLAAATRRAERTSPAAD